MRFIAFLLSILAFASPALASLHLHGSVSGASSSYLVAGSNAPVLGLGVNGVGGETGTPTWSPLVQPARQGSSGAAGYNDDAIGVWDSVPFALHGINGVEAAHSFSLCVAADQVSGIAKVAFFLDGGAEYDVSATSTTPGGSQGYCAPLSDAAMADGLHEIRAIVYPNAGIPLIMQSGGYATLTASGTVITQWDHGLGSAATKIVTILNADAHAPTSDATFAPGSHWCLISSGGAGNFDGDHYQLGALTGWPSSNVSCSATATAAASSTTVPVLWYGAGAHEQNYSMAESLFFETDANGTLPAATAYADDFGGSDANACSQASPCKTIHAAKESLVATESSAAQTVGSSGSCTTFTKTGNTSGAKPFALHSAVVLEGAVAASGTSGLLNSYQTYFIQSAASDVLTLAATPNGPCLNDTITALGTVDLASDLSNDSVYMVCNSGAGCSGGNPALYQWGAHTETVRYATFGMLNVIPDPATATISDTAINGSQQGVNSPSGIVQRAHVIAQVNPGLIDGNGAIAAVTTATLSSGDNPAGQGFLKVELDPNLCHGGFISVRRLERQRVHRSDGRLSGVYPRWGVSDKREGCIRHRRAAR